MKSKKKHTNQNFEIVDSIGKYMDDDIQRIIEGKQLELGDRELPPFDEYRIYKNIQEAVMQEEKRKNRRIRMPLFWCGMLGILLSLGSFPWDLLRQNAVFQVLTFSMQSPTIFMIPAICGLTFIVCGLLNTYREEKSATEATILETAVLAVAFVSTQFLTNKLLLGRAPLWIRQKEDLPDVVLIEAPQFQMSAAAGAAQLVAVALSALGIVGIVIYCILTQKKNPDRKVQKEAA